MMVSQSTQTRWTYEEYVNLPDDLNRYEIIGGELYVAPSPGRGHQTVSMLLSAWLLPPILRRHAGVILSAPFDVVLADDDVVQPDLLFVSRERLSIVEERCVRGAPDLVIEVLSPSTSAIDRGRKRETYAQYGVRYYWLFDPGRRTVEAYELVAGEYRLIVQAQGDAVFAAPPFPDIEIPLAQIWEWPAGPT